MGKINGCLKCLFIFFNVVFAIVGCLLIFGLVKASIYSSQFAGFMGIGMIIMLIFGIVAVVMRNKVRDNFRSASSEVIKTYMAQEGFQSMLNQLQETAQCCGLTSPGDWGDNIPSTCRCKAGSYGTFGAAECKARPQGTSGPDQIYTQTCGEFIIIWSDFLFNVSMGVMFTFAVTALLGLLVSLLMIHQVRRHDQGGASSMSMKGY
uniref:tetraspanin-6-like isoform X2 n=1 Tax=Doryrhamphus excisus TaxID=161450 RepID=UPI0025AE761F|nr:tetraspanin-6-like isoform X2 [Doryrhamphus excisus]